jgi:hypothetical protein
LFEGRDLDCSSFSTIFTSPMFCGLHSPVTTPKTDGKLCNSLFWICEIRELCPSFFHLCNVKGVQEKLKAHTHRRGGEAVVSLKYNASASLPSNLGDVTGSEDEHLSASIRPVWMSDSGNQRRNVFRLREIVRKP